MPRPLDRSDAVGVGFRAGRDRMTDRDCDGVRGALKGPRTRGPRVTVLAGQSTTVWDALLAVGFAEPRPTSERSDVRRLKPSSKVPPPQAVPAVYQRCPAKETASSLRWRASGRRAPRPSTRPRRSGLVSPARILFAQPISFDTEGRSIEHALNVHPAGTQVFEMRLTPSGV